MNNNAVIEINNLTKKFGGLTAVNGFSGVVKKHQIVGIIGPNGAGKTTILNMISGIYNPTSGSIVYNDQDITYLPSHKVNHLGIARTFQNINLYQDMTVLETIMTAYSWRSSYTIFESMLSLPSVARYENEIKEKSLEWIKKVDLLDVKDNVAKALPYGMQRRVEIARALASEPNVLLLDEPGAGVNQSEIPELVELIKNLYDELNISIVLIDHRMDVIMQLCDWIYVQDFGKSIAQGTPEQVQKDPVVIKAYLGEELNNA